MHQDRGAQLEPVPTADVLRRAAELAEWVGFSFERVAATYLGMAEQAGSGDRTERLLEHVARLQRRAARERAEAERFRQLASASDHVRPTGLEEELKALP